MDAAERAKELGRRADRSHTLHNAVRVGIISYGVVHLIIAYLALRLAFGSGGGSASSQGALHQLAQNLAGQITLYVVAAGFTALVVWQVAEALAGHHEKDGKERMLARLTSVGKAVLYGFLGFSAAKTAVGSSSGGGTDGITAKVMGLPGGTVLVTLVGVAIIVVAGVFCFQGWSEGFREKLDPEGERGKDGRAYIWLGRVGYVSKGVALGVVGVLFGYAGLTHDPNRSGGLDQALHKVLQQPFGAPVLVVIALGIACFGLFCFAWARHLDR